MGRARQLASKGNNFSLTLDSTDFNALLLNRTDLSVNDVGDNVLLDGTDGSATDAGFRVELETQTTASETDTNIGERLVLNGTNDASLDAGFSILQEDETDNPDVRITSQIDNGVFKFTSPPINDDNPAFYIGLSTDDTNAENAYSKILYDRVFYDTINGWDLTNYRYQPSVSGFYYIYAQITDTTNTDVYDLICAIFKGSTRNGLGSNPIKFGRLRQAELLTITHDWYLCTTECEDITFFNGDDDYIEIQAYGISYQGSTVVLDGDTRSSFVTGHLISRESSANNPTSTSDQGRLAFRDEYR